MLKTTLFVWILVASVFSDHAQNLRDVQRLLSEQEYVETDPRESLRRLLLEQGTNQGRITWLSNQGSEMNIDRVSQMPS